MLGKIRLLERVFKFLPDMCSLTVKDDSVRIYPKSSKFGQDIYHFVSFQIVNENVGEPEIFDKLQVHGNHHWFCVVVLSLK